MSELSPLETIFFAALEKAQPERGAYVAEACAGDASLRRRVEKMLAAQVEANSFLEVPPAAVVQGDPAIDQPVAEKVGTQIGPYKLLQQIGEGGMGVVYMAEQNEPVRRKVALKIIKPGMDTRQVIARFEAERQALAVMDHPNIAKVLDAGTTDQYTRLELQNRKPAGIGTDRGRAGERSSVWNISPSDLDFVSSVEPSASDIAPGGRPYFVMELVKGIPITQYCDEQHLTLRQRLELMLPVCHAIQHAHQKGIVHRDIKPTNILVAEYDERPMPKVIDFGVAKAISQALVEKTMFTGFGQIVGTLEYMSPEQAKFNQLDIDTRSDIYSLGVLLYELLTGSTPFDQARLRSAGWDEMLRIIREEEPLKPSTKLSSSKTLPSVAADRNSERTRLSRAVRGELDWIVMKALEKDRNRRYETAAGFAQDLERYLADQPVQACPSSAGYRLWKLASRHRGRVLAGALVLLALVAGMIGTTWGMIRAEQARRSAVAAQSAEAIRATAERQAKLETQKRLTQLERGTELLASVFQDLDPIAAEKAGLSTLDLVCRRLGDVAQQLDGEAVGDPLVVARLQHLLGVSLRELRQREQAEHVLLKAWRTRERLLGRDHLETVASKHELAVLYRDNRKSDLAEALFKEVVAIRSAKLGHKDLVTLTTKHHLAVLYRYQGKYAEAESLSREVLAIRTEKLGADDLDTVAARHNLAVLYRDQNKYAAAEAAFREVIAIRTARLGPDHLDTLSSKGHLALLYESQQKLSDAEQLRSEIAAVRRARLGADHRDTLRSQYELAGVYWSMNKFDQAIALMEETLQRSMAIRSPETLGMRADLGAIYCDAGRFTDAIPLLVDVHREAGKSMYLSWVGNALLRAYIGAGKTVEAIALVKEQVRSAREQSPADSLELAAALAPLGRALRDVKAYAEAEPVCGEVLAIRTDTLGRSHHDTLFARDDLALTCRCLKKFDQSIPLLKESLQLRKEELGSDHPEILARLVTLGGTYCDAGRYDEGLPLIEEIRAKGSSDPHPGWVRTVLLTAYVQAGKSAQATTLVAERVQEARQLFAAGCPPLAAVLADNGKCLFDAKAYAEAEPLLLEAYQILQDKGPEVELLSDVVKRLAQLYDAWGKPEDAAKWRSKLVEHEM